MQELGNTRDEHAKDGTGEKGNHYVLTGNGSMSNYVQSGTQNTQINAETYHDNQSNIGRQHVHGTLQLQHARIQQITQNSFSGPVSIRASTIASNSSRVTVISAAASLLRSADRLHRTFIECNSDECDVQCSSPFLLFRNRLQQIQNALKPGQNNEHRLDLISFQDYFLVLVQAFQLFTDIDQNIADLHLMRKGTELDQEALSKQFHTQDVDDINEQLQHQCDVLTSATYVAAQQSARKVTELGDRHAEYYSKDLAEIDKNICQAQKLLSSITNHLPQLAELTNSTQEVLSANAAAQAEWERELINSPAYSRALQLAVSSRFSISTRQSTARSEAWPSLDLISLANISIISVVDLPVLWESLSMLQRDELDSIMETAEFESDQSSLHTLLSDGPQAGQRTVSKKRRQLALETTFGQKVLLQSSRLRALANRQAMWHALAIGDEAEFQVLLSHGYDSLFRDRKSGNTLLEEAAKTGKANFINMIFAQSRPRMEEYENAVNLAIVHNQISSVQAFICQGIELTEDWKEHHPLPLAASLGQWQIVNLLLPVSGHAINRQFNGNTPLTLAIIGNHLPVVEILLANHDVDLERAELHPSPLVLAVDCGCFKIAQALMLSGRVSLHQKTLGDETALSQAFLQQNDDIARLILQTDATTLRDAIVMIFSRNITDLTDYAQELVRDQLVRVDQDGSLFRTAILSQNSWMVVRMLDHAEDLIQQRLAHAITTGDLRLMCSLRNYIWSGNVEFSRRIGVSTSSLLTATRNTHLKEVLEVLQSIDKGLHVPNQRYGYISFAAHIDNIQDHIDREKGIEQVVFAIRQLDQWLTKHFPDKKTRLFLREKGRYSPGPRQPEPDHWLELPAQTLLTR